MKSIININSIVDYHKLKSSVNRKLVHSIVEWFMLFIFVGVGYLGGA